MKKIEITSLLSITVILGETFILQKKHEKSSARTHLKSQLRHKVDSTEQVPAGLDPLLTMEHIFFVFKMA